MTDCPYEKIDGFVRFRGIAARRRHRRPPGTGGCCFLGRRRAGARPRASHSARGAPPTVRFRSRELPTGAMRPLASRGVSPRLRGLALVAALGLLCACSASAAVTLELAQTHVFPAPRREWKDAGLKPKLADVDLHLVGERDVLAIVEFGNQVTSSPKLFVSNDRTGANAVEVALRSPDHMPDTQGDAVELYSHTAWTLKIPGELVTRGMQIFVEWAEGEKTWSDITVGAPTPVPSLVSLPLLLFRRASRRHEGRVGPSADARVGRAHAHERGGGVPRAPPHLALPHEAPPGAFLPLRPRRRRPQAGGPAYSALAQGGRSRRVRRPLERDANHGGDPGHGRREAARDAVLRLSAAARRGGEVRGPGAGIGGGGVRRGTTPWRRLFPRGGARVRASARRRRAYDSGSYPYPRGSLKGSGWGYDAVARAPRGSVLPPVRPRGGARGGRTASSRTPPGRERALLPAVLQAGPHARRAPRPRPEPVLRHLLGLPVRPDSEVLRGGDAREGPRVSRREGRRLRPLGPGAGAFAPATLSAVDVAQVTDAELTAAVFTVSCAELGCEASASASGASLAPGALKTGAANLEATQVYPPLSYRGDAKEFVDVDNPYTLDRPLLRAREDGREGRAEVLRDRVRLHRSVRVRERRGGARDGARVVPTVHPADGAPRRRGDGPAERQEFPNRRRRRPGRGRRARGPHVRPAGVGGRARARAAAPRVVDEGTRRRRRADVGELREAPAARHAAAFDLAIAVPSDANHCAMDRGLPFVRARSRRRCSSTSEGTTGSPSSRARASRARAPARRARRDASERTGTPSRNSPAARRRPRGRARGCLRLSARALDARVRVRV